MDVRLRFRGIGLLLTLLICSPILAQEPETEDSHPMPGNDPHSGCLLYTSPSPRDS